MNDKKVLVAYFSWSGNTQYIAEKIHNAVDGDIFRIETKMTYPKDYHETAYVVAKKQHEENEILLDVGIVMSKTILQIGYYYWKKSVSKRLEIELPDKELIEKIFNNRKKLAGYRTIRMDLEKILYNLCQEKVIA